MNKELKTFIKEFKKLIFNFEEKTSSCCKRIILYGNLKKSLDFPKIKILLSEDKEYRLKFLSIFSNVEIGKTKNTVDILDFIKQLKKFK